MPDIIHPDCKRLRLTVLESWRPWLRMIAESGMSPVLRASVDISGVIQQTLYEAHLKLENESSDARDQAAILKQILKNNLTDAIRKVTADKRDVRREFPIGQQLDHSSARLEEFLLDNNSSPSQKMVRFEQVLVLARELERLPKVERTVIVARYIQELGLAETALLIGRSKAAVAGVLQRGLKRLRQRMNTTE